MWWQRGGRCMSCQASHPSSPAWSCCCTCCTQRCLAALHSMARSASPCSAKPALLRLQQRSGARGSSGGIGGGSSSSPPSGSATGSRGAHGVHRGGSCSGGSSHRRTAGLPAGCGRRLVAAHATRPAVSPAVHAVADMYTDRPNLPLGSLLLSSRLPPPAPPPAHVAGAWDQATRLASFCCCRIPDPPPDVAARNPSDTFVAFGEVRGRSGRLQGLICGGVCGRGNAAGAPTGGGRGSAAGAHQRTSHVLPCRPAPLHTPPPRQQRLAYQWGWRSRPGCRTRRHSRDDLAALFRGRHLAFMGDSHVRYFHNHVMAALGGERRGRVRRSRAGAAQGLQGRQAERRACLLHSTSRCVAAAPLVGFLPAPGPLLACAAGNLTTKSWAATSARTTRGSASPPWTSSCRST